jgi:hypothetical protein
MTTPIVFVDTETDGVHPARKPWEIAIIRRDDQGERELSFFVEIDLSTADPFGLKIGGFYDRHPLGRNISKGGPINWRAASGQDNYLDLESAARHVAQWTHGAHWVGAVPNFDTEVLATLLRDQGLTPAWHYHLIDVEAMAVGYAAGKGITIVPPWKSDDLMDVIGVEKPSEEERHTALGDARWCKRTYDAVMGGA